MDQSAVVEGAMLDFNTRFPLVDEQIKIHVRYLFNLVWMAGCEHRSAELSRHNLKPVQQFDRYGNLLHTYPSLKDAASDNNILYNTLQIAISRGSITHKGRFFWRFLDSVEGVSEVKQKDGFLNTEVVSKPNIDKLPSSNT